MTPSRALLLPLLVLAGCAAGAAVNAAVNTAAAVSASAVSRAQGNCYATCPDGTACNHATGLCEALPCRGRCGPGEVCEQRGTGEQCLPASGVELNRPPPTLAPERVTPR